MNQKMSKSIKVKFVVVSAGVKLFDMTKRYIIPEKENAVDVISESLEAISKIINPGNVVIKKKK